jgi:serine/threonine-protein kinase
LGWARGRVLTSALAPGALVGDRYRVISPLASGGFGAVYVAEQITTERRVALKLIVNHSEGVSFNRLLSEARIATRLNSDHIVQVLDAGIDAASNTVFVVMELLSGATLDDLVEQGPLSFEQTAEFMRQVAVGLDKAHGHVDGAGRPAPIVHRDLKPANIFVTRREDGTPLVKILDFGTAKILSSDTQASALIRGTPQYMAYEQAAGEPITCATDIWAFGLIAFHLLTGRAYWLAVERGGSQAQLFGEVLTLPLARASERARELGAPALPPAFDDWFERCVNRDVAHRFASAGLAARELGRALGVLAPVTPLAVPSAPLLDGAHGVTPPQAKAKPLPTQAQAPLASMQGPTRWRGSQASIYALVLLAVVAASVAAFFWKRAAEPELPAAASGARVPVSSLTGSRIPSVVSLGPTASPTPSAGAAASTSASASARPSPRLRAAAPRVRAASQTPDLPRVIGDTKQRPASPAAPAVNARTPAGKDVYEER